MSRASSFNGSTSKATSPASNYRISDSSGAVSFWFRTSSNTSGAVFAAVDTVSSKRLFVFEVSAGGTISTTHVQPAGRGQATDEVATNDGGFNDGNTHHVVVSSNGSSLTTYVDGVEKSMTAHSGANDGNWFSDLTAGIVGIRAGVKETPSGESHFFDGTLDELAVFNSALNASEVSTLYNSGSGVLIADLNSVDSALFSKVVNAWPLDADAAGGAGEDIVGSLDLTLTDVTDVAGLI